MNYDLAIMALEGLARAPLSVQMREGAVMIEGQPEAFKELARLCLLIGGGQSSDGFELQPGVHVSRGSAAVHLRVQS
jgi:hypothetical protein